jgi:AraC family transcriptional activator of pobA
MMSLPNAVLEQEIKDSFSIHFCKDQALTQVDPVRVNDNHIFLFHHAQGVFQVDDNLYELSDRKLFLLAKGQIYRVLPGSRVTCYELCFTDNFWELAPASASNCKAVLFNNAAENQMLQLVQKDYRELNPLMKAIHLEYLKKDYTNKPDALAAYLKIIMIKMANLDALLANGYDDFEKKTFQKFRELISKEVYQYHQVSEYADQLGISSRKLTTLCKRCSGKGAKDLINSQIVVEAKRFLQFSAIPIKEIAFQLQFSTPEQFSHFFKRNANVSPQDFRNHYVNIGM